MKPVAKSKAATDMEGKAVPFEASRRYPWTVAVRGHRVKFTQTT